MESKGHDFFSAFVNISKAISTSHDLREVLDLIVKHGVDSLSMKAGSISLWNRKENRLELITQRNLSEEFINKGPAQLHLGGHLHQGEPHRLGF